MIDKSCAILSEGSGWLREGCAVLCSFIDCFLLLVACLLACLVSLSCLVSRVRERELHFFISLI